jgi:hypothetical protein
MRVVEHEGMYKSSRIAGPKHNYLGIAFSNCPGQIEVIERNMAGDVGNTKNIAATDVMEVVVKVVERESTVIGRRLFVARVEYIPTDTPEVEAYEELATTIARYALQKLDCVGC